MLPKIKSFTKFADAASVLAAATASLYFLGYVYYSGFCERLGVRFYGIDVSFRDYLVVCWKTVFVGFSVIAVVLVVVQVIFDLIGWIGGRKESERSENETKPKKKRSASYIWLGVCLLYLVGFAIFGAQYSLSDGQGDAENIIKDAPFVTVRDSSGNDLPEMFIYLRDFGGALMVGEVSDKNKVVSGIRIIKQGSYSSYTIHFSSKEPIKPKRADASTP